MKKILALIFISVFCINVINAEVTWKLSEDGTLTISGTGSMVNYSSGYSVPWYPQRESIKNIIIENGVTSIGNNAFYGCKALTSLTIPNNVTSIGYNAFGNCTGLTSITIPNSITSIGRSAFYKCSALTSITIPNSVTNIGDYGGDYAFELCSALTSIKVEEGNKYYDSRNNCNAIIRKSDNTLISGCKNTIIPNDVESIANYAFSGCMDLISITIPNSVTNIGDFSFSGCTGLTSITLPNSVTSIGSSAFSNCLGLTSVAIPNSVTNIGSNAFSQCSVLSSVTIPNSVSSIGKDTFYGCRALTSVTIPNGVTSIGESTFYNCSSLSSITIPNSVTSIGNKAFYGCHSLASVTIPNSVTSIGGFTFYECTSLTSVIIPNSVTNIDSYAFWGCSILSSVTIPNSVTTIGWSAFSNLEDLRYNARNATLSEAFPISIKSVTIGNGVEAIPAYFLSGNSYVTSITIPESVTSIGEKAFSDCKNLIDLKYNAKRAIISEPFPTSIKTVTIGNEVETIPSHFLYDNKNVTSITIPNSVTTIEYYAFQNCTNLVDLKYNAKRATLSESFPTSIKTVTIGNEVEVIPSKFLLGNKNITSITIPNSVTSIGNDAFGSNISSIDFPNASNCYFDGSMFYKTEWYKEWNEGTENYLYLGDCLFAYKGKDKTATIKNGTKKIWASVFSGCDNLTSVTIPNSVTSIGEYAFQDCWMLTSITIPNGVTSIAECTFSNCMNLTSVTIPNSVTFIDKSAFSSCLSLRSINIPNGVTSIGDCAFIGCTGLTSVTISKNVTRIGDSAFSGCIRLKEIYLLNPIPPEISTRTFEDVSTQYVKVFVPEGAGDAYKYPTYKIYDRLIYWTVFANIYEMAFPSVLPEAKEIIVSDGTPTITKGYYKEKTITYVRESSAISKDNYASFCLPFAVDPVDAQFKTVYVPLGVALYNTEQNTLRIGFYKENKIIPAGTPFLAILAVDDKVEIKNALPVNYDSNMSVVKSSVVRTYNSNDCSGIMSENNDYAIIFSGTYQKAYPTNANTFNTDGSVGPSAYVAPYRAYIDLTKNRSNAKIITSFDEDAETTGITNAQYLSSAPQMYDLNGRMVDENAQKSGVYIKNGKKYIK